MTSSKDLETIKKLRRSNAYLFFFLMLSFLAIICLMYHPKGDVPETQDRNFYKDFVVIDGDCAYMVGDNLENFNASNYQIINSFGQRVSFCLVNGSKP